MANTTDKLDSIISQAKEILVLNQISEGNDLKSITTMTDDLFEFALENFKGKVPPSETINEVFGKWQAGTSWLDKDFLSTIEPGMMSLVLMKEILGHHKVPVNAPQLKTWPEIIKRFGDSLPKISS